MSSKSYLTAEGLKKLKAELEQLKMVERPAISRQIAEAREKGDLSENAEYDAAKEAQGLLELKIHKLENIIANARLIDESRIDTSTVQILNKVRIRNLQNQAEMEYMIVADSEADLKAGKMAVGSPIAKALLGKEVGDTVEVQVPSGKISFEILTISI